MQVAYNVGDLHTLSYPSQAFLILIALKGERRKRKCLHTDLSTPIYLVRLGLPS